MDFASPRVYLFGDFQLDVARRRLLRAGEPVPLTPRAFDTLLYLVERRGTVLGRDELLAAVWPDVAVEDNNLGQAVSKLRHVLGETPGDNRYIVTIPGRGYRFAADVTVLTGRKGLDEVPAAAAPPGADAPSAAAPHDAPGETRPEPPQPRRAFRAAARVMLALAALGLAWGYAWWPRDTWVAEPGVPRTLAVLPFQPLVTHGGDAALEFGMADSLIMKLGHIRDLTVLPLAAVRRFHAHDGDASAAGRELGVDAVLHGHIHQEADRVRVTVVLRGADGGQLWAGQYDEQKTGIFDIQDAISERVTQELALRLTAPEEQRLTRRDTEDAAAYEDYLKGRFFLSLAQPRNAIEMFERAVRLDPNFARARAGLADTLSRLPIAIDGPSAVAMGRARALALAALDIDPDLALAHAVLGWIAFYYDWDWRASEEHYRHALTIDGSDFSARLGYAHLLSNTLRAGEAIRQVDLALEVDPLSPLAGTLRSQFLFYAGRHAEAAAQLQRTLETSPAFWIGQVLLGRMHLRDLEYEDAAAAFATAAATGGGAWTPRAFTAYTYGMSGRPQDARPLLRELVGSPESAAPPYLIAVAHAGLGDPSAALTWLERAYEERDVRMVFLGVDPVWEPLRGHGRFAALLQRMHLEQRPRP